MHPTCLIAAHDPWLIQLLRAYSEESGFRVVQAFEGQDVHPITVKEKPAAIFLQVDIPGHLVGHDVVRQLRRDSVTSKIPLFAFSWLIQEQPADLMNDVTAYLHEPITYSAFQDALNKAGVHCQGRNRAVESEDHESAPANKVRLGNHSKSSKRRVVK